MLWVIEKTEANIQIYPNPSNGIMQLDYSLEEGQTGEFVILDMLGRKQAVYTLSAGEGTLDIQENKLSNGVYIYYVRINDVIVKTDKISIQH